MKRENWKYIILGIGLGFLLSAALFLKFGGKEKETLSEREVIEKAKELGMVFLTEKMAEPSGNDNGAEEKQEPASKEKSTGTEEESESRKENLPDEESAKSGQEPENEGKEDSQQADAKTNTDVEQEVEQAAEKTEKEQTSQTVPKKSKSTKKKDSNEIKQVISEEDKDVKDLTPPKNPNRPKQGNVLDTNHF